MSYFYTADWPRFNCGPADMWFYSGYKNMKNFTKIYDDFNKHFYISPDGVNRRFDLYDSKLYINITTSSLNSFTSSINTTIKNKLNVDEADEFMLCHVCYCEIFDPTLREASLRKDR